MSQLGQQTINKFLKEHFFQVCSKNPLYSLRAFAKYLNISSASLSEILNEKRNVSHKKALEFARRMDLSEDKIELINNNFNKLDKIDAIKKRKQESDVIIIKSKDVSIFLEWDFLTIFSLLQNKNVSSETSLLARKLNISEARVKEVIEVLKRIKAISIDKNGLIKPEPVRLNTHIDIPTEKLKQMYVERLKENIMYLNHTHSNGVDMCSSGWTATIPVSRAKLKLVRSIMSDFLDKLTSYLSEDVTDHVITINMGYFPRIEEDADNQSYTNV